MWLLCKKKLDEFLIARHEEFDGFVWGSVDLLLIEWLKKWLDGDDAWGFWLMN